MKTKTIEKLRRKHMAKFERQKRITEVQGKIEAILRPFTPVKRTRILKAMAILLDIKLKP